MREIKEIGGVTSIRIMHGEFEERQRSAGGGGGLVPCIAVVVQYSMFDQRLRRGTKDVCSVVMSATIGAHRLG